MHNLEALAMYNDAAAIVCDKLEKDNSSIQYYVYFYVYNCVGIILQRVKHSKIADGIEGALESKKFLQSGMDADQVRNRLVNN